MLEDDDRMLERLSRALEPPGARPGEAELSTLRTAAAHLRAIRSGLRPSRGPGPVLDGEGTRLPPLLARDRSGPSGDAPGAPGDEGDAVILNFVP